MFILFSFGAPVGIFVTTDAYLGGTSRADVGLYLQSVMQSDRELNTYPQAAWIR